MPPYRTILSNEEPKLLRPLIQEMAEDVNNDPELDFFSEIEGEGLENDDD
jgi:hypothetical protein